MSGRPASRSRKPSVVHDSDEEEEAAQKRQPKRRSSKKPAEFVVDDDEEDSDHQLDSDAEINDEDEEDVAEESEEEGPSRRSKRRSAGGASAGGSKRSRIGARGAFGSGRAAAAAATAAAAAAEANEERLSFGIPDGLIQVTFRDVQNAENKAVEYRNAAEADRTGMQTGGNAVSEQGFKMLVRQIVRYVIFAHSAAPGVPIPRNELTKLVSDNSNSKKHGLASAVLTMAQAQLALKFGLDLAEQAKGKAANGPKQFVLRSVLPRGLYAAVVEPSGTAAARGFLAAVMCLIQIAGGSMAEEELWRHLGDLGVTQGSEHPALGNPTALLEEFVKKRHLHMDRVSGADGIEKTYSIAENAELKERDLQRFCDAEMNLAA